MFERLGVKERAGGTGYNQLRAGGEVHLALYMTQRCWYCRAVFTAADRLGVDLEYRNILRDEGHLRELLALTGRRTVPCMLIDGEPLFESARIVEWFSENLSGSQLQ